MKSGSPRFPGLDLLRAFAVLMVIVFHYSISSTDRMFSALGHYGWMGVDLFFVLSGYLIGSQLFKPIALGERLSFGIFLRRRLLRTLPNFLVVLALYFSFPSLREHTHLPALWKFLTFTQNLGLNRAETGAFSHAWSLCVEEQFYLILPLISFLLLRGKISTKKVVAVVASVFVFGVLARGAAWTWIVEPLRNSGKSIGSAYDEFIYYPTYARLDGLLVGISLALIKVFRKTRWENLLGKGYYALGFSAVCMVSACILDDRDHSIIGATLLYPLVSLSFGGLLIASISPVCEPFQFRIPGIAFLAKISFGVYLLQKLVFHWSQEHLPGFGIAPYSYSGFLVTMGLCAVSATLLFECVEKPFLILRDRLERKPEPASLPCGKPAAAFQS